jgi:glycine/D-amino acid oxidase-like deaminating enzyme
MVDVLVVGAGIVGASIAYHAARQGASVTVVDRSGPASGVTGDSFGWIGSASGHWPGGAQDLRSAVLADYRRLEAELPGVQVRWTGSLAWTPVSAASPEHGERCGPGQRVIGSAAILELEPRLRTLPSSAVSTPTDGGVDPGSVTRALLDAACGHGAEVWPDTAVTALRTAGDRVVGVESSAGSLRAETVVVATGADAPALCVPLGVELPVASSPAVLVRLRAPAGLVRTVLATPDLEVREVDDGRLLMTVPYLADVSGRDLHLVAARARRLLASTLYGAEDVDVVGARVGHRPVPADGAPIIGGLGPGRGVYVAVMHSAVTLAPTVGRLVAGEILSGADAAELRRCRPARFTAGLRRRGLSAG